MANEEAFLLKWNNFQSSILSSFENLLEYEELVDVTLACEGQQLKAHKVILCASSSYFHQLFKSNPCQHPIVFMKDVRFEDLKAIMTFMYHGEVNVSQDRLEDILRTAESLNIKGLTGVKEGQSSFSSPSHILTLSSSPSVGISCMSPPRKRQRRCSSPIPSPPVISGDMQLKEEPEELNNEMECVDVDVSLEGEELILQDSPKQILGQDSTDTLLGGVISQEAMHSSVECSPHKSSDNTSLTSEIKIFKTKRGKEKLYHAGYTYTKHYITGKSIRWRCAERSNFKCPGKKNTNPDGEDIIEIVPHNHGPGNQAMIGVNSALDRMKELVLTTNDTPSQIYSDVVSQCTDEERACMPSFDTCTRTLRRFRHQNKNLTTSLPGLGQLPEHFTEAVEPSTEPFGIFDDL